MMAEGTYDYECMRAELLGLEKPDLETFEKEKQQQKVTEDEHLNAELQEVNDTDAGLKEVSGGLDELNSILSITQQKITKFKTVCGSLTNLLKIKVGGNSSSSNSLSENADADISKKDLYVNADVDDLDMKSRPSDDSKPIPAKKLTLEEQMVSQMDKLDSLICKADNAQYSMSEQNKQMKKFLK